MRKVISWKDFTVIFAVVFVIAFGWYMWQVSSEAENKSIGIANPAAVMCHELGYKYEITDVPNGQIGICIMPDGQRCSGWKFYSGECGAKFNYCARNGYNTITRTDGKDAFSPKYAVCVNKKKVIGSVVDLMDLSEKLKPGCQDKTTDSAPVTESMNWFKKLKPGILR